jgi:hypothetical protein
LISKSPSYEIFNLYFQLVVTAYDSGSPGKTATATLTIDVTKNPSIPQFDRQEYSTTIWEDRAPGSNIINITAVDADSVSFHLVFIVMLKIRDNLF